MAVSPARMHSRSSGKKGRRKARMRKVSVLARTMERYLSEMARLTRRSAKIGPARVPGERPAGGGEDRGDGKKKEGQVPKSIPPAAALRLLGMGASTTDRNWSRKNRGGSRERTEKYSPEGPAGRRGRRRSRCATERRRPGRTGAGPGPRW